MPLGAFRLNSEGEKFLRTPSVFLKHPFSNGSVVAASTPTKFGYSIGFTNACLYTPVNAKFALPSGSPWTYEAWVYPLSIPNPSHIIIDNRNPVSSSQPNNRAFMRFRYQLLSFGDGATFTSGTTHIATNTWYHCAVTYQSGIVKVFLNGNLEASGSYVNMNLSQGNHPLSIAASISGNSALLDVLNCYVDEVRISNVARYTASFSPQIEPFENDLNTLVLLHADMPGGNDFYDDPN